MLHSKMLRRSDWRGENFRVRRNLIGKSDHPKRLGIKLKLDLFQYLGNQ